MNTFTLTICIVSLTSSLLAAPVPDPPARDGGYWAEAAKLAASDVENYNRFGESVSISGDTALVGAPRQSASALDSGAAYVYVESAGSWTEEGKLFPADVASEDWFGFAVSIDGDTAVIGAPYDDDAGSRSGSAYVFVRSGTTWTEEVKLTASDAAATFEFGQSVIIRGDTALVGAPDYDQGYDRVGAVYVFVRSGSGWVEEAKLTATIPRYWAFFGYAIAFDGDTAVIGAPGEAHVGDFAGAAYVFTRSGSTWTQQARIIATPPAADASFGVSVSVSGDTALVGNADYNDEGSAYVFVRTGSSWHQEARLVGSDSIASDWFGGAVAVLGDRALVGAVADDDLGWYSGAAYVFEREGPSWTEQAKLLPVDWVTGDARFGESVALSDSRALIGANANVWGTSERGSAHVFDYLDSPGAGFCFGDPGSGTPCPCSNDNDGSLRGAGCANGVFSSGALLAATGIASVTNDSLVLRTAYQEPSNSGLYFQGTTDLTPGMVWGDGLRCTGGAIKRLQVRFADVAGSAATTIPIGVAGGVNAGDTRYYQLWYRTVVAPPCGPGVNDFNSSNGNVITWQP